MTSILLLTFAHLTLRPSVGYDPLALALAEPDLDLDPNIDPDLEPELELKLEDLTDLVLELVAVCVLVFLTGVTLTHTLGWDPRGKSWGLDKNKWSTTPEQVSIGRRFDGM